MTDRFVGQPSNFERLAQGTAVRDLNIERYRTNLVSADIQDISDPISISPTRSRRPGFVATSTLSVMALGAAVAAACSGGGQAHENTGGVDPAHTGPAATATEPALQATPTIGATATEVQKPQLKLSEEKFKPTTFEEMVAAIDAAYAAHPDIAQLSYLGGPPFTREYLEIGIRNCRSGLPEDAGKPKSLVVDRTVACSGLIGRFQAFYMQTGYSELHQAAVACADYILTDLPGQKANVDKLVAASVADTTPSLPQ